jgi:Putative prokaryotic signal transducing protein
MREILRTNDLALISFVDALLADAGIAMCVLDAHTAIACGSTAAIERRVMVADRWFDTASQLVSDARIAVDPGAGDQ